MLLGVEELVSIPITEAVVVVPVPMLEVKFLIVFEVKRRGQLLVNMPTVCEDVPVAFSEIEFATVPPTLFEVAVHVVVVEVKALIT